MQPFETTNLRPGTRLPKALFTRQGVKLLSAEVTLSEAICRTLGQFPEGQLFLASGIEELRQAGVVRAFSSSRLRAGATPENDLVTLGGVLAVESGEQIEPHHLDALEHGAFIGLDPKESAKLRAQRMKLAEDIAADREEAWAQLPLTMDRTEPPLDLVRTAGPGPGWPDFDGLRQWRGVRVHAVRRALGRVLSGVPTHISEFEGIVDDLVETVERFPERFPQVALCAPHREEFLPDHAFTTSALCIAMTARLGWGRSGVRQAGLAGLLADTGMGLIPSRVRSSTRKLDDVDANRIRRHPAFSVMLLSGVEGLPEIVSLAAYQHHERENGSGYPRALKSKQICDLAKVVAVADTFAASIAPRPYKPTKRPYDALEELLMMGTERQLDRRIIRSLVESTGLFPVGSFVKLSTGDLAEVVGAHPDKIDRPIVTVVRREGRGLRRAQTIDLNDHQPWELHVILPADRPADLAA